MFFCVHYVGLISSQGMTLLDFEDDEAPDHDPVASISDALNDKEAQKTEELARSTLTDVASIRISSSIRKARVDGDALRHCIILLSEVKQHYDKLINEIGQLTSKERKQLIVMFWQVHFAFIVNHVKEPLSTKQAKAERIINDCA